MLAALALVAGCGKNSFSNGYAVDLVVKLDPALAATASSIRTLQIDTSGAETGALTLTPSALPLGGEEHIIYRPLATGGEIVFSITARDAAGAATAFGEGTVALKAKATATLTVVLGNMVPPGSDMGPPDPPVITPAAVTVARLASTSFTASQPVTWSVVEADGGTIDADGNYTAPAMVGTYHVQATLVANPAERGLATVSVVWGHIAVLAGAPGGEGAVDGTGGTARFGGGEGLTAIDAAGNLYLPDRDNQTIRMITPAGVVTTILGQVGQRPPMADPNAQLLNDPYGVAVNSTGTTVYFTECANHTVARADYDAGTKTWTRKLIAGQPGVNGRADAPVGQNALFNCPVGITLDAPNSTLYVTEYNNHDIRKIDLTNGATAVTTVVGTGACGAQDTDSSGNPPSFCNPLGLVDDGGGNLYVADTANATVRKVVVATAAVSTLAGAAGQHSALDDPTGTTARLVRPVGIALAAANLYVTDQVWNSTGNHVVRRITLSGTNPVTTIAGTSGTAGYKDATGTAAQFNTPSGIAVLGQTAYVWDDGNFVVRKLALSNNAVTTFAGSPAAYGTALDNGDGAQARFNQPFAAVVDAAGTVYVADSVNCAIRTLTVSGDPSAGYSATVATLAGGGADGKSCGDTPGPGASALIGRPQALEFDGRNTLHVIDGTRVRAVDLSTSDATVSTLFSAPTTTRGLAEDAQGTIYFSLATHTIGDWMPVTGELREQWGVHGYAGSSDGIGEMARFSLPSHLLFDAAANALWVADTGNATLRRLSLDDHGVVTVAGKAGQLGGVDGIGGDARLSAPYGMARLPDGRIVFADGGAHAVRIFDPRTLAVTTALGILGVPGVKDGPAPGGLSNPRGVALLPTGELIITDIGEQVVQIAY